MIHLTRKDGKIVEASIERPFIKSECAVLSFDGKEIYRGPVEVKTAYQLTAEELIAETERVELDGMKLERGRLNG